MNGVVVPPELALRRGATLLAPGLEKRERGIY
jgi:hypothetical protein